MFEGRKEEGRKEGRRKEEGRKARIHIATGTTGVTLFSFLINH